MEHSIDKKEPTTSDRTTEALEALMWQIEEDLEALLKWLQEKNRAFLTLDIAWVRAQLVAGGSDGEMPTDSALLLSMHRVRVGLQHLPMVSRLESLAFIRLAEEKAKV